MSAGQPEFIHQVPTLFFGEGAHVPSAEGTHVQHALTVQPGPRRIGFNDGRPRAGRYAPNENLVVGLVRAEQPGVSYPYLLKRAKKCSAVGRQGKGAIKHMRRIQNPPKPAIFLDVPQFDATAGGGPAENFAVRREGDRGESLLFSSACPGQLGRRTRWIEPSAAGCRGNRASIPVRSRWAADPDGESPAAGSR
jgi:hypothetical protein